MIEKYVVSDCPPLMIEIHEFGGRVADRVEEAGEQSPLLGAYGAVGHGDGHGRLDDTDGQQSPQCAVADPGQVGAVAHVSKRGGNPAGGRAHQELCTGGVDIPGELSSIEAGVGQQEHRAVQCTQQAFRIGEFAGALGAERGGHHGTAAAFDQDHEPQQRVAELPMVAGPFRVAPGECRLVGCVQQGPVDGHRAQSAPEGTGLAAMGDGSGQGLEQTPQRSGPYPPPGPRQRRDRRPHQSQPLQPGHY